MNERDALERRVAALVRAYADRAPTGVDPITMARLAAAGSDHGVATRFGSVPLGRLAFALLVLALVAAMAGGALVAGRFLQRDPEDMLTRAFVKPFTGLPPEGTAPSTPETGELVLSFMGRVNQYGLLGFTQVYEDGRLISGVERGAGYDVVEQYLTPEGVDLMRSAVLSSATLDPDLWDLYEDEDEVSPACCVGGPGVVWGALQVQIGEQRFQVTWSDAALPARIVDPESWLPEHAWLDPRSMPYVASRYAVCVGVSGAWGDPADPRSAAEMFEVLPETIRSLIRSRAIEDVPRRDDVRCLYEVTTTDARVIEATLETSMADTGTVLRWTTREQPSGRGTVLLELLRVLPDGGSVCNCG